MSYIPFASEPTRPAIGVRLPETVPSFIRKWSDPTLSALPENVRGPVMQIDYDRARRGAQPLGQRETILALRAAAGETPTPKAERSGFSGFVGNAANDIAAIATSIPKLPGMLLNEVRELPEMGQQVSEGLEQISSGDVGEGVAQIAGAPGVRMLPGAFVAESLGTDPGQLGQHPVMTLLDVLPFAGKAAAGLPRVQARMAERATTPLRAATSEYVGRPLGDLVERATGTRPGAMLDRAGLGPGVKDISVRVSRAGRQAAQEMTMFAREVDELFEKYGVTDPEDQVRFTDIAKRGDPTDTLSVQEQQLVGEIRKALDQFAQINPERMFEFRDELFPMTPGQGQTLRSLTRRLGHQRYSPEAFERLEKLIEKDRPRTALADEAAERIRTEQFRPPEEIANDVLVALNERPLRTEQYDALLNRGWDSTRIQGVIRDRVMRGITHPADMLGFDAALMTRLDDTLKRMRGASGVDTYKAIYPIVKKLDDEMLDILSDEFGVKIRNDGGGFVTPSDYARRLERMETRLAKVFTGEDSHMGMVAKYLQRGRYNRAAGRMERATIELMKLAEELPNLRFANDAYLRTLYRDAQSLGEHARLKLGQQAQARVTSRENLIAKRLDEIEKAQTKLEETYRKSVPGRFMPLIQDEFRERLRVLAESKNVDLTAEAFEEIMRNVDNEFYDVAGLSRAEMAQTWREVSRTWVDLKEAGFDPTYLHSVDTGQVAAIRFPRIYPERITHPSQYKAKTMDAKPYVNNFSVALKHQGLEFIQERLGREVIDGIQKDFGRSRAQLYEQFAPKIRPEMMPPGVDIRGLIEREISRDWVKWDETGLIPIQKARATLAPSQDVYIPKWAATTLKKLYPDQKVGLSALWDKATNVFRISILPFAPRWHIYNTLGGAVMLGTRTGLGVLGEASDAWKMAKATRDGLVDGAMPIELARGMGSVPREFAAYEYAAGKTKARLFQEMAASPQSVVSAGVEAGGNLVNKLFDINTFVDDFYRSMAFLYGQKKALRGGMSETAAREAGIELANKVLQNWDAMRPIERSLLRNVFPFYGWMKHILSYTATLPIDHPLRMAIISNFARNEIEDWGLPQRFYAMFILGDMDKYGNVTAINFRGSNPFSDVSNYMSLTGFINQLNPMFGGALEAMGIDEVTGKAELYPDLVYNDVSGRVEPRTPNPAQSIVNSLVPQVEGILAGADALGISDVPVLNMFDLTTDEMRVLQQNNPEAFRQRVFSALGMPPLPRTINLPKEQALAELSRNQAAQDALRKGLRSGDWSEARRYPSNRPILERLDEYLAAGALDDYILPEPSYPRE